jgi:hypothetical protein
MIKSLSKARTEAVDLCAKVTSEYVAIPARRATGSGIGLATFREATRDRSLGIRTLSRQVFEEVGRIGNMKSAIRIPATAFAVAHPAPGRCDR